MSVKSPVMSSVASSDPALRPSFCQMPIQPSPVGSSGTEGTEIEEEAQDTQNDANVASPRSQSSDRPKKLKTAIIDRIKADDEPQSVILAPTGFKSFQTGKRAAQSPATESSSATVVSLNFPESVSGDTDANRDIDRSTSRTPQAKPVMERRQRRASSLQNVPEEADKAKEDSEGLTKPSLETALGECWQMCNTFASLPSPHHSRSSNGQAWQSCWRLCRQLYDKRDEDLSSQLIPTLEHCRDFCKDLFAARVRGDEATDAVLRVSFELNNHLLNTDDSSLPEAFHERTLDFYISLCHRLMKQRLDSTQDNDALLRSCWALTETLFSLRQHKKEGGLPDVELLNSALQACLNLSILFHNQRYQVRPEKSIPKASFEASFGSQYTSSSNASSRGRITRVLGAPETPTTIFTDTTPSTASSPDSAYAAPNILVLGPSTHWSTSSSALSTYSYESASSQRSSSTARGAAGTGGEKAHLQRLRYLLLKAAIITGYCPSQNFPLPAYVQKSLSPNAFGMLPWQIKALEQYKRLVLSDRSLMNLHLLPHRRLSAREVAAAVSWLIAGESGGEKKWAWMRDLFRSVFGMGVDEVDEAESGNGNGKGVDWIEVG
ncbi:hypothetical protein K470DRAFT_251997 [Piedraia hortae CBS 480.64]|uniref:DUF7624 domain-containing protein n=1 Tax=Piedraia hortae CBS 480.64 TaxID=1314780 RepID=A0A6A7BT20_9PEZI|nr:hypothetical protein K470DRAFT_251997 [Piedraia hortae CBS 480.64]